MGVAFWVYENWQAGPHKSVIHQADCGFCNEGKGLSGGDADPTHGKWHGPFDTLERATRAAKSIRGAVAQRTHSCVTGGGIRFTAQRAL